MVTDGMTARNRRAPCTLRHLVSLLAGLALCGLGTGCHDDDLPPGLVKKAVAFDQVPEVPRGAAKKAFPKVEFKEAWENIGPGGQLHSYEIRGRQASDGKIREVRVSPTGQVLESE